MAERTRRTRATSSRRSSGEDSGGGRLNRDYGDEEYREPGEGYNGPTPKKGLYPAKLVSINDHVSSDGNESVRWCFELTGGTSPDDEGEEQSVAGFRDYQYTNDDTTLWREQQIAVALGLVKPNGKLNATYAAILKKAKPCTVRLIRERYIPEDGDPEWRAKIAAVLAARDNGAAKTTRRRAKDEDAEDVFDDETDGDEDEEEEETPAPARSRRSTSRSRRKAPEPEPEDEEEEPEDEDEEGDEEPYDPDELAAELEDLGMVALKKRARDEFGVKITRGMKADAIIDAILETLDEGDEDEEDEEPEEEPDPPKRSTRSRQTASRSKSSSRKRGSSEEPPF